MAMALMTAMLFAFDGGGTETGMGAVKGEEEKVELHFLANQSDQS